MEERERARTGISSLKIRFNRVFGYYIEISKSNLHAVPADYHRKQTIAGGERFITPALKEYEEKVLGADERILERELEIFEALRARVAAEAPRVLDTARALAALDVLAALAETATRLQLHQAARARRRRAGGHRRAPPGRRAAGGAARSCRTTSASNATTHQLVILTGPNMGGKSTYLRQVGAALPAGADRLVRAGARGQAAASSIASSRASARPTTSRAASRPSWSRCRRPRTSCNGATSRSLVVLDEIGRGTATFDGLSIAWAVAEYLATQRPRPAQDALRHALPRADRSGRCLARRGQRPRRRARVEGRHRLPAQDRARPIRSQLRHPGRAARRPAGAGDRPRPRHPARARAGRAEPRRPSRDQRTAAARRSSSSASSRRCPRQRNGCAIVCARWTSTAPRRSTRCSCCRS